MFYVLRLIEHNVCKSLLKTVTDCCRAAKKLLKILFFKHRSSHSGAEHCRCYLNFTDADKKIIEYSIET